MELKQELERTAPTYSRQEELRFIFGDFIDTSKEEWYEIGESEGYRKGESERNLAIAQNLVKQGVEPSVIAAATGLTLEEIARLC